MEIPTSWPSFPDGISVFDIRNLPSSKVCFQSDSQGIRILHTSSQSMVVPSVPSSGILPSYLIPPGFPSPCVRHHASGNPNPPSRKSGEKKKWARTHAAKKTGQHHHFLPPPPPPSICLLMKRQKADDLQQQSEAGMRPAWHGTHTTHSLDSSCNTAALKPTRPPPPRRLVELALLRHG